MYKGLIFKDNIPDTETHIQDQKRFHQIRSRRNLLHIHHMFQKMLNSIYRPSPLTQIRNLQHNIQYIHHKIPLRTEKEI